MGGHMYTCGQFMLMYGKNHHNIVIILQLKELIKIIKVVERIVFLLCTSEIDAVLILCTGKRNLSNVF